MGLYFMGLYLDDEDIEEIDTAWKNMKNKAHNCCEMVLSFLRK